MAREFTMTPSDFHKARAFEQSESYNPGEFPEMLELFNPLDIAYAVAMELEKVSGENNQKGRLQTIYENSFAAESTKAADFGNDVLNGKYASYNYEELKEVKQGRLRKVSAIDRIHTKYEAQHGVSNPDFEKLMQVDSKTRGTLDSMIKQRRERK